LVNLQELRYLVAVADHRHFGKAASACCVSQPTLSMQLKKLEDILGGQLVERTNKAVHVTPLGEMVVARARQALAEAEAIMDIARRRADPDVRNIEIGVIPTLCPYLLPWAIPAIRAAYPKFKLTVYEDFTANLIARLDAYQLDAAILSVPVPHRGFESLTMFEEPFWFACNQGHPLAAPGPIAGVELRQAEMLVLTEGHCMRDQMLTICDASQVQVAGGDFRATSLETIVQMVKAGMGCTLLPGLAVRHARESGLCVRALEAKAARRVGFVWRGSYLGADDIAKLADVIVAHLPETAQIRSLA